MKYIFVDLDKTFISIDITFYLTKKLFKYDKTEFFKAIFLLCFYGEIEFKRYLSNFIDYIEWEKIDTFVNKKLTKFLEKEKAESKIILATGAHFKIAEKIVERFSIFEKTFIATEKINCIGVNKLIEIKKITENFMYIGDEWNDIPIWEEAEIIGIVSEDKKLIKMLRKTEKKVQLFV